MTLQIAVTLAIAIICGYWALAKVLLVQTFKQLDSRFASQEELRTKSQEHWELRFIQLEALTRATEKDLLLMRGDLPNLYVRREDYIRGQTVIESKLDAVYSKLELVQIQGAKRD
ncbi:MAG: hypothetical protein WCK93_07670 [Nitrosomonadales bacterium]